MKLVGTVPQAISRNIVGLVSEVEGLKSLRTNGVNLKNTDTLVFVDLLFENGTELRTFCSKAVSAKVRSKEISLSNLLSFPVVPFEHEDGDIRNYIQMPAGSSNTITVDVKDLVLVNYVPKTVNFEELIAL